MVNATIPGTYVEIKAGQRDTAAVSGVVAMPLALSWGDRGDRACKRREPAAEARI